MIAEVLGLDAFDEAAVEERLKTITVDGDTLVFRLTDGSETRRLWEKPKRRSHPRTKAQKDHMREVMLQKWTPEKKEAMSEKMKKLRKERGAQWRKM